MYESPIKIIQGQLQTQLEGQVMKAIQNVGVVVDKEELIRALKYDRGQYSKGFRDGTPKWIPVTERLPEEWVTVLVWSRCGFCETAVYLGIPGKWRVTWNHDMLEVDTITHWMPLPEPPEGGDNHV